MVEIMEFQVGDAVAVYVGENIIRGRLVELTAYDLVLEHAAAPGTCNSVRKTLNGCIVIERAEIKHMGLQKR